MPPPKLCVYCGEMYEDALYYEARRGPDRGKYIFFVHWECLERTAPVPCPFCEERMSRFIAGVLCPIGYYCTWCKKYFRPGTFIQHSPEEELAWTLLPHG